MRSWGLVAATTLLALVGGVVAFLHIEHMDAQAPLGFQSQVRVQGSTSQGDPRRLSERIAAFADNHDVTVARVRPSTDDALSSRHLYLAIGAPESPFADWLTDGYPAFSRDANTIVQPWADLDFDRTDPRGFYLVAAPTDVARDLVTTIRETGFTAQADPFRDVRQQARYLADSGQLTTLLVATLVAVVLVGATVLLGAKSYGVARLHGHGLGWMLANDLGRAVPGLGVAIATVGGGVAVWLGVYNDLHQFGAFVKLAAMLFAACFACTLCAYAGALWLTNRTTVVTAIKGRIPDRATLTLVYVLRAAAAVLAIQAVAMAVNQYDPARAATHDLRFGQQHANGASYLLLKGTLGASSQLRESVATWLQQADEQGRVVLASVSQPDTASRQPEILIVNPTYLHEQTVLAEDGTRLAAHALPANRPVLFVPAGRKDDVERAHSMARERLAFAARRSRTADVPRMSRVTIAADQELFTYGTSQGASPATVTNAFVLVVPPQLRLWGPAWVSMAEDVVVVDSAQSSTQVLELPAGTLATQPVVEILAANARDAHVRWWTSVMNAVVAIALLLAAVAASVAVYTRGWAMRIFVRFAHGWPRVRANPVLIGAECAVAALLIGRGAIPWLEQLLADPGGPAPPTRVSRTAVPAETTLLASLAVVVVAGALAVWVLRIRERGIFRDRAIDRM